jgi:FKBP-type peptidyl-prolyl cis-trans isomerase 2
MLKFSTGFLGSAALVLSLCPLTAPASEKLIQNGEQVRIDYVCRLKDGAVAAATYPDGVLVAEDRRAGIYLPLKNAAPVEGQAGQKPVAKGATPFDFADAIATQLTRAVVGLVPGQVHAVEVAAGNVPVKPSGTLRLARVRRRPKELRMAVDEFRQRTGKEPAVGGELTFDPALPGEVVAVNGQEVVIKYRATVGDRIDTPFGPALVSDDEHHFLLTIAVEKGALVRSGAMVGRIVEMDGQTFTVDYGHPLAGEDLTCDVTVTRGEEG